MKANGPLPIILAPFLYAIFLPVLLLFLFLNEIARLIVKVILQIKYKGQITLISEGHDAIWGGYGSDTTTRMALATVFLKKGTRPLDVKRCAQEFKRKVLNHEDKNGNRPYKKFEKIMTISCGYSCWKECEKFNVENHFRNIQPEKLHNKSDVQEILSKLTQDMADDKPQWEMVTIQRYKENPEAEEKCVNIYRFQHAYMDGLSVIQMMRLHLADNFQYAIDPLKFSIPLWKRIFFYINFVIYAPYYLILLIWTKLKDSHWVKMNLPSGKRNITWAKDIDMEIIQKIRTETRSTVTNVVGSAFVVAAKKVLPSKRLLEEIVVGEIAAMLPYPNSNPQNRFTSYAYSIPTVMENPLDKIRRAKMDSLEALIGPQILLYYMTFSYLGRFPPTIVKLLFFGVYESLFLSNVPISKTMFRVFGLDVEEFAAWPPQPNDTGISMTSLYYKNNIKLCGIADSSWLTKSELERIFEEMPRIIFSMANVDYPEDDTIAEAITENEITEDEVGDEEHDSEDTEEEEDEEDEDYDDDEKESTRDPSSQEEEEEEEE